MSTQIEQPVNAPVIAAEKAPSTQPTGAGETPTSKDSAPVSPRRSAIVQVRYWAGARAAAGVETETFEAATVGELLPLMSSRHEALESVLQVASILVDGLLATSATTLDDDQIVEVLPPFAGG